MSEQVVWKWVVASYVVVIKTWVQFTLVNIGQQYCPHSKCISIKRTTHFPVHYEKIRIQLRKIAVDNAKVHLLARKNEHCA